MSSSLNLQQTLAIIKPHASRHRFSIVRRVKMAGFRVLQERCVKLTVEQASEFLHRKSNDCKVATEIENLSSGPMVVLCLARENAVDSWKQLMGPENCSVARKSAPLSLRALYGDVEDEMKNAVYGSESVDDVGHELQFFFPNTILEPVSIHTGERINNYLCSVIYQPLTNALYEMTKVKPDDPLEWLANYMLCHNSNKPLIHETNPQTIQKLIEMRKEEEEREQNRKRIDDSVPAKCGCYLFKSSSHASSSTSTATCTKY